MSVSGLGFTRTVTSKMRSLAKKVRLPLLICKIVAVLFLALFSGVAVSAGPYSNCSYDELVKLSKKFKAQGDDYKSQAKQYESLALPYKHKDTTSATTIYTNYMLQSSKYSQLASQAYGQQLEVEKELSDRRNNPGTSVPSVPTNSVSLTKITVSVSQSSVKLTSSVNCYCKATYSDGVVASVSPTWSVSNTGYGHISGSTFYPSAAGVGKKVTVKAVYNGFSATKTISIANTVKLASLSISGSSSVPYGGTKSYTCDAKYSDNTTKAVTAKWSVNNTKYGSFSGSKFTAKAAGAGKTVTITASFDGKKVSKKITLKQRVLSSLSIKGASIVKSGEKTTLSCTAKYDRGSDAAVKPTWSSSNTKVATVSTSGVVTGKKGGVVTITAKYKENGVTKKASKKITIKQLTKLSVSNLSLIGINDKATLTAKAKYSDGTTATVTPTWSSSNTKVATVSASGVVTGKQAGNVTITAQYKYGNITKSVIQKVTVFRKLKEIVISGASTLRIGKKTTMTCTAKYNDGTEAKVTPSWGLTGDDDDGWHIDIYGELSYVAWAAKSSGVTVTASYQGCSASKNVTLTPASGLYISGPDSLKYLGSGSYYLYQDGQKVTSTSVSWSCGSLCTISDQGCYGLLKATSQLLGGISVNVTVTAKYNGKTVTKSVKITR